MDDIDKIAYVENVGPGSQYFTSNAQQSAGIRNLHRAVDRIPKYRDV